MLPNHPQEYQFLFANMTDGAFFQNFDGEIVDVNPAALSLLGFSHDQFLGRSFFHPEWRVINEDGIPILPEQFPSNVALGDGTNVTGFVAGVYNPQRQTFVWVQINAIPMFLPEETLPYRVLVTLHDISAEKRSRDELHNSEARFRAFVENSFDVIFILDATGTFRFVSPSWEQHFGYPASEVIGSPFAPVVHPDDVQPCFDYLLQVMGSGQPGTSPGYRVRCADGSWKLFIANGSRFIDSQGEVLFHGIGRDISDKQRMLEQLKASDDKFTRIFSNSPVLISLADIEERRFLDVNDRFCEVSGFSREEIIGRTPVEIGWVSGDDLQRMQNVLHREGRIENMEVEPVKRDGSSINCLYSAEIISIAGKKCVLSTGLDITRRCQAETALRLSDERYRAVVNSQQEFVDRFLPGGIITFVNEALCRYAGLTPEELIGTSFFRFVHENDRERLARSLAALTPQQPSIESVDRVLLPDGSLRWHHWTSTAIFDSKGAIAEYQSVGRDITRQKLAEDAREESERLFRQFFNLPLVGTAITSPAKGWLAVNDKLCSILGYAQEELFGLTWSELTHPDDLAADVAQFDRVLAGEIDGYSMEKRFIRKDGTIIWAAITAQCLRDQRGEVEYFAGLLQDISEKKQAESLLQQERLLLTDFINATDVMLVYLDPDFNFLAVNNVYAETCRMLPAEMVGRNHFELYPHSENEAIFRQVRDSGIPVFYKDKPFEFPDQPERQTTYWDWSLVPMKNAVGGVTGLVFSLRETTAYKLIELARLEYAENLEIALKAAKAGTWNWIIATNRLHWSKEFFFLLGMNPDNDDASFATWQSILHPDDYESVFQSLEQAIANESDLDMEYRIILPDGTIRWLNSLGHTECNDAGEQIRMRGICLDISERKQQEEVVRRSEQTVSTILNATTDLIMFIDPAGTIGIVNKAMARRLGCSIDQALGTNIYDYLSPDLSSSRMARFTEAMDSRCPVCFDDMRGGFYFENNIYPVMDSAGDVTGVAIFARDTTASTKQLEELAYVNECFTQALNGSQHILYRLNVRDGGYDYLSPVFEKITGYQVAEFSKISLEQLRDLFHPDDRVAVFSTIDNAVRTQTGNSMSFEFEYRLKKADGTYCWLHDSTTAFLSDTGELECFFGSAHDVTERKRTEQLLQASEERLRKIIEESPISMAVVSMDGTIEYINNYAIDTFGYQLEDIPHMNDWWHKAYPDPAYREQVVAQWMGLIEKAIAENRYIERREYQTTCKNGTSKTMLIFGVLISSKVFVVFEDITERKRMELDLRESEERYRRFITTANEGIGIVDRDYTITYVNERIVEMIGYSAEELLGKHVSTLLPDIDEGALEEKIDERKKGISSRYEYKYRRMDGTNVWLLISSTPIIDAAGAFQGAFSMFTDLTDRKNAEDALLQAHDELELRVSERTEALAKANEQIKLMSYQLVRAEEQERVRIAAELHDQVGQSLLLAKIKSDMLASEISDDNERSTAAGISFLLENSLHDIRTLTFSMRPPLLDSAGIEAALELLCTSLCKDYGLEVNFSCNYRPPQLAGEKSYLLFQSIRELLLNVAKHAGVNRAELIIQRLNGGFEVRIADNGVGFNQPLERTRLAVRGGFGLFNVQQRIEQIGGSFVLASSGQGTVVTLTIPLE